jgi:S1-C subfamily serine protease
VWDPDAVPPPPRRRRRAPAIVAFLLALFVFASAFGIGRHDVLDTGGGSSSGSSAVVRDQGGSSAVSDVAAKVTPGIVNITTTLATGGEAAGTGMVISSNGLVLTNNHVIDGANTVSVEISSDGSSHSAKVLGYDVDNDVALLQIRNVSDLATVPIGDSSRVSIDDTVVAIGNALGRGGAPTVTSGTVAALNQTITAGDDSGGDTETLHGLIQINASIQPGDSGGALVNADGEVIGMNTAAAASGRFSQTTSTVAFAIPINAARSIASQIAAGKSSGSVHIGSRGIMGIRVENTGDSGNGLGGRSNSGSSDGALVMQVDSGGPADSAGIRSGDVIVAVAGQSVGSTSQLNDAMAQYHTGDKVSVTWSDSSGTRHTATLTLVEGPPA